MKYRVIKYLFAIGWLLALATGCRKEFMENRHTPDGQIKIMASLNVLPNEVVMRATTPGTLEENKVIHPVIYEFKNSDKSFIRKHEGFAFQQVGDQVSVDLTVTEGSEILLCAVANVSGLPATPTYDQLKSFALNGQPATPFAMYGEVVGTFDTSHNTTVIEMNRVCAAISLQVASGATGFTLEGDWAVYNVEHKGYLNRMVASDPASSLQHKTGLSASQHAYTYPRDIMVDDAHPATFVIFKAKYMGRSYYYKHDIHVMAGRQVFQSNHLYAINIVKITEVGYASPEEAIAAAKDKKVVFTVSDWDDKNSSEVAFFGNYYMKISQRYLEFDYESQAKTLEITTNVPDVSLVPPAEAKEGVPVAAFWTDWSLFKSPNPELNPHQLNVAVYKNESTVPVRKAFGYIRAEGIHTDDFKIKIDLLQKNYSDYIPATPTIFASPGINYVPYTASSVDINVFTVLSRQEWFLSAIWYDKDFIESTDPEISPDGQLNKRIGNGILNVRTKSVSGTSKRHYAMLHLVSGKGENSAYYNVGISQGYVLDYDIIYPSELRNKDIARDKYVIETPMEQTQDELVYTVRITANSPWKIILPGHPWETLDQYADFITVNPDHYDHGSTLDENGQPTSDYGDETRSVDVTVRVKKRAPDAPKLEGFPYARQLRLQVIGLTHLVPYINQESPVTARKSLYIYQGGVVKIKDTQSENYDYWLDRNLKTGYRFSESYSTTNAGFPMLYEYAIPIGHKTSVYGAYAKSNTWYPRYNENYGDDGFFPSGSPQSGMLNSSSTVNPLTVKYYRSGWKTTNAIYLGSIPWPNDSGTYNPCPPGWEVPKREQWQTPMNLVNRGGGAYGRPTDLNLPSDYSFLDGTMTVNNCGKYIVVGDAEGTPTSSDDIYYFYPSAGYRFLGTKLFLPGAMGNYQTSDKFDLSSGASFGTLQFYFNSGPAFFYEDLGSNSSSVRCVLKQEKKPAP